MYIDPEYREWEQALHNADRVLDLDPENAEAYLGIVLARSNVPKKEFLRYSLVDFEGDPVFKKLMNFAKQPLRDMILRECAARKQMNIPAGYIPIMQQFETRSIPLNKDTNYKRIAEDMFRHQFRTQDATGIVAIFEEPFDKLKKEHIYNDVTRAASMNNYESLAHTIDLFSRLGNWNDAEAQKNICMSHAEQLIDHSHRSLPRLKKKMIIKRILIILFITCFVLFLLLELLFKLNSFSEITEITSD